MCVNERACISLHVCVGGCVYWHVHCQSILCTLMYLVKTISKYDIRLKYMLVN